MAAPISGKGLIVLCFGALVLVLVMKDAQPTEASSFVFYSGACSGSTATLNVCGCNTVPANTHGGYKFTYTGQTAAAYNSDGCTGVAQTRFSGTSNTGAMHCCGLAECVHTMLNNLRHRNNGTGLKPTARLDQKFLVYSLMCA